MLTNVLQVAEEGGDITETIRGPNLWHTIAKRRGQGPVLRYRHRKASFRQIEPLQGRCRYTHPIFQPIKQNVVANSININISSILHEWARHYTRPNLKIRTDLTREQRGVDYTELNTDQWTARHLWPKTKVNCWVNRRMLSSCSFKEIGGILFTISGWARARTDNEDADGEKSVCLLKCLLSLCWGLKWFISELLLPYDNIWHQIIRKNKMFRFVPPNCSS